MIDDSQVTKILRGHAVWSSNRRNLWNQRRDTFADKHWRSRMRNKIDDIQIPINTPPQSMHKVQINHLRPWVIGFIASLYYRGIHTLVLPDQIAADDDQEAAIQRAQAVQHYLDRFFETSEVEDAAERLFEMGLLYEGGCALKIGVDSPSEHAEQSAMDLVWVEAVPPWEFVVDRKSRSLRTMRYFGHLYPMAIDKARELYGAKLKDAETYTLPDVVAGGLMSATEPAGPNGGDDSYVMILEFYDLTATHTLDGVETLGEWRTYHVTDMISIEPTFELLSADPMPFASNNGMPLRHMVPFIPEPILERGLDSAAPGDAVYELNAELNDASSVLAEAYRRDAQRIILYLKNKGVTSEDIARIVSGEDLEMVGLDTPTLEGLFRHLETPPISSTLLQYVQEMKEGLRETKLTADATRGKAGQYLSATEAANLVNYSESTVGRTRKRMDKVIAHAGQVACVALADAMAHLNIKSVPVVMPDKTVYELSQDDLDMRWRIQVVDSASTPAQAAQKIGDFMTVLPQMMQLAEAMGPEVQQQMAREGMKHLVDLMDLPESMNPTMLEAAAPQPEPEPEALPQPMPQEMPMGAQPTEEDMLMAQAQAAASQALGEM